MATPARRPTRAATKDYSAIARKKITRPSEAAANKPPTFHIYGRYKKGKTRFAVSAGKGKVLIVDPEHGTDRMQQLDPDVWYLDSWEELDEVYKFLKSGDHNYEYVCLDALTRLSNMCLRFVMAQAEEHDLTRKPGMVHKQDYGKAGELMKGMLYNFHNLPIGKIYCSSERQIDSGMGEDDEDASESAAQMVPDLPKGVRAAVNSIVDVIGRIYTVKVDVNGETKVQRRLWLEPSVMYDTGYRSDYVLPQYLKNPTVPRLVQLLHEGKVTSNARRK